MLIWPKTKIHYIKNIDEKQIPNIWSALKFLARYSSQSQNVNFLRKSHKDKAWNDWKPKRNEKSIHRQIQAASLHFALFLPLFRPKMDQKRARSGLFGIIGAWINVLDDVDKEWFFSLPKCGGNSNFSDFLVLALNSHLGFPEGSGGGFFHLILCF